MLGSAPVHRRTAVPSYQLIAVWSLVLLLDILSAVGVTRLAFDDGLMRTFQSSNPRFEQFLEFRQAFPGRGEEILLLIEADDLSAPGVLVAIRDLGLELSLLDGISGVLTPFSVRSRTTGIDRPVLEGVTGLASGELEAELSRLVNENPELARTINLEEQRALLVVQPDVSESRPLFAQIDEVTTSMLEPVGVDATRTGYATMRANVADRLWSDLVLLNVLGVVFGTLASWLALRNATQAILVAMSAGTALLWVVGLMGLFGIAVNVVTVALPILILTLSFSDSLHLSFEARRQIEAGLSGIVWNSVKRVGPACILASVTTAIAFAALTLSSSSLLVELGRVGAVAVLAAGLAVLVVHPLLHVSLARVVPLEGIYARAQGKRSGRGAPFFDGSRLQRNARVLSAGALAISVVSIVLYLSVPPQFSLRENARDSDAVYRAADQIAATFGPHGALHFMVPLGPDGDTSAYFAASEALADSVPDMDVVSLATFQDAGSPLSETEANPWISEDGAHGLISVLFHYSDAAWTRELVDRIETELRTQMQGSEDWDSDATGLEAMTSFVSADMLGELNISFLAAVAASALVVGFWLRDPLAALAALVPNVLPIALVGAWLSISGQGLQFAGAIALIIAFGIVVDDTLHVLNRLRLRHAGDIWPKPMDLLKAVQEVAPILIITSVVLSAGLLGTFWSSLPSIQHFGALSISVFALALVADLVVLPAVLISVRPLKSGAAS